MNMDQKDYEYEDGTPYEIMPCASTVVDLIDSQGLLRQGTWGLSLHQNTKADTKLDSNLTSGLPHDDENSKNLNDHFKRIELWRKRQE